MAESETAELPAEVIPAPVEGQRKRSGFWPELAGALTVGLAALAGVVLVFQILAWARDMPGPGTMTVAGHLAAAGVAVLAQRFADRLTGWRCVAAVLSVVAVSLATLWVFWWA